MWNVPRLSKCLIYLVRKRAQVVHVISCIERAVGDDVAAPQNTRAGGKGIPTLRRGDLTRHQTVSTVRVHCSIPAQNIL